MCILDECSEYTIFGADGIAADGKSSATWQLTQSGYKEACSQSAVPTTIQKSTAKIPKNANPSVRPKGVSAKQASISPKSVKGISTKTHPHMAENKRFTRSSGKPDEQPRKKPKVTAQAKNHENTTTTAVPSPYASAPRLQAAYGCDYMCGFMGTFNAVRGHEVGCALKKISQVPVSEKATKSAQKLGQPERSGKQRSQFSISKDQAKKKTETQQRTQRLAYWAGKTAAALQMETVFALTDDVNGSLMRRPMQRSKKQDVKKAELQKVRRASECTYGRTITKPTAPSTAGHRHSCGGGKPDQGQQPRGDHGRVRKGHAEGEPRTPSGVNTAPNDAG